MNTRDQTNTACNGHELSRLSVSSGTYHEFLHRKNPRGRRASGCLVLLLSAVLLLLVVFLIVTFTTRGFGLWLDTGCHTKQCVQAASRILNYIDLDADPCADFYQFACGNYGNVHVIPPGKNDRTPFEDLRTTQSIRLSKLLETGKPDDPPYVREAKILYETCMNETKIDELGIRPLQEYLTRLGGWTVLVDDFDMTEFVFEDYWVKLGSDSFYPSFSNNIFSISIRSDPDDHTKNIIAFYQAKLGMGAGTRDNYLNGTSDKLVKAYAKMINDIAKLLGARYSKREISRIVDFEIELAKITLKPEDLSESAHNSRHVPVVELNRLYPGIDWRRIIVKTFETMDIAVNDTNRVRVGAVPFFEKIGALIRRTSRKTVAGYLMWRNIDRTLNHLDKTTREIYLEFSAAKTGIRKEGPRFRRCTGRTNHRFPMTCGRIFADENFRGSTDNIQDLTRRVKSSFQRRLEDAEWLDEESRERAKEKVDAMIAKIGFPDYLRNDTELGARVEKLNYNRMDRERYFFNVLDSDQKQSQYSLRRVALPVDRYAWLIPPITVNAYYSRITNGMTYPLGVLYPPFYDHGGMQALNFGAIGEVIGHEITHGFDDSGRLYDKEGNKKQWMTRGSVERFKTKAQCIIDAYNNITVEQIGEKLNGKLTQGENIADIGGLAQAFDAYRSWVEEHGKERRLPGLDNLNPYQIFFVGYAQLSCSLSKDEGLKLKIRSDPHTPARERVLGALYHTREFGEVFNCPVGSRMNPKDKCPIW